MKKSHSGIARRIGVAEAKAELSQEIKNAAVAPTIIHNRGRDVAVLLGVEEYERLSALDDQRPSSMAAFVADIEILKKRLGGGAELEPPRLAYVPRDPFGLGPKRGTKRRSHR